MPFFTRLQRASHFPLCGQEKATTAPQERREQRSWPEGRRAGARGQEKATPMQRSPGILPSDCAKRFRGWLTVRPCTGSQLARIHASHPAGNSSTTSPPHRGPHSLRILRSKAKDEAKDEADSRARWHLAFPSRLAYPEGIKEKVPGRADEGAFALIFAPALNPVSITLENDRQPPCYPPWT